MRQQVILFSTDIQESLADVGDLVLRFSLFVRANLNLVVGATEHVPFGQVEGDVQIEALMRELIDEVDQRGELDVSDLLESYPERWLEFKCHLVRRIAEHFLDR